MDDVLLSNVRLSVVCELLTNVWVTFGDLLATTGATNGNLSTHMTKLTQSGYVREEKSIVGRRPQTRYTLTARGKRAFYEHLEELQTIARVAQSAQRR